MTDIWFGTSGPRNAKIALVGEAWGSNELAAQRPFVGASGEILTKMLADAGINRADCFLTNIIPVVPPRNRLGRPETFMFFEESLHARKAKQSSLRGLYPGSQVRDGLDALYKQLAEVRPSVIVALGNYALWALCSNPHFGIGNEEGRKIPTGITSWRGSQHLTWNTGVGTVQTPPIPVIPTFNPAGVMNQWGFRSPAVHDLRKRLAPAFQPLYNFITRPTYETCIFILDSLIEFLPPGSWLSRDYETAAGHADCLGIAWSAHDALCIPFCNLSNGESYWTVGQESEVRSKIAALFARKDLKWSGQNFNYELQYEDKWFEASTGQDFDTMIAHHVLWPGTPMDLTYLSSLYCSWHRYWGEASWWEDSGIIDERWIYNCEDAARTWEITQVLRKLSVSMGFENQVSERMEVARANLDIMLRGIRIDTKMKRQQGMDVFMSMQESEAAFESLMPSWIPPLLVGKSGRSPWYRSNTQQMRLFYDLMGQPEHRDKKTKARTVDDDALQKISASEPLLADLCSSLLAYRSAGVYYSNFLTSALDPDERMRCSLSEGPVSFRMRSGKNAFGRGTNLQNIPKMEDT